MKILMISPLSADCDISLYATRYPTAAEWDAVEAYVAICRRAADRAVVKDYLTTQLEPDDARIRARSPKRHPLSCNKFNGGLYCRCETPLSRLRAFCDGWERDHGGRTPIVEEGGNHGQLLLADLIEVLR